MSFRMDGRTVILFGGGSVGGRENNGLCSARAYAAAGADVFIVDNSQQALDDSLTALAGWPGAAEGTGRVEGAVADVTDEAAVARAVAGATEAFGTPDVLHNNVGIAPMGGPLDMELDEWDRVLRINLTSVFLTMRHVLAGFLEKGGGAIVNISSLAALRYLGYDYPAYSATKGGMVSFTRNVALEYASQGIRANCIAPGFIETPMVFDQIASAYGSVDEMVAQRNRLCPTGKMGHPSDVANTALFLASDAARYVNGVVIPVDGGLAAATNHLRQD